jgi:CO/xanthine dehydrogenase Mo-binding subunit
VDNLARELGVDPIVFRRAMAWQKGSKTPLGQPVGPCGLAEALDRAARLVQTWRRDLPRGQGIGMAAAFWSTSTGAGGEAELHLTEKELVIRQGEREIGTGSVVRGLVAVAERVLGLPSRAIRVEYRSTADAPFDSGVFGSRTLGALGQAVGWRRCRCKRCCRPGSRPSPG